CFQCSLKIGPIRYINRSGGLQGATRDSAIGPNDAEIGVVSVVIKQPFYDTWARRGLGFLDIGNLGQQEQKLARRIDKPIVADSCKLHDSLGIVSNGGHSNMTLLVCIVQNQG